MHPSYDDIVSRIAEPPSWWQSGGVPRWGDFGPLQSEDIYADEVALVEIACQSCDTRFRVCFSTSQNSRFQKAFDRNQAKEGIGERADAWRLSQLIQEGGLTYGDPPNTGCCASGASMNSVPIRVLEYWHSGHREFVEGTVITDIVRFREWRRRADLEIELPGL